MAIAILCAPKSNSSRAFGTSCLHYIEWVNGCCVHFLNRYVCLVCLKFLLYSGCSRITFGNIIIIIHSTYVQFENYPVTADIAWCMRLITQCGLHGLAFVLELGVISAYYVHVSRLSRDALQCDYKKCVH